MWCSVGHAKEGPTIVNEWIETASRWILSVRSGPFVNGGNRFTSFGREDSGQEFAFLAQTVEGAWR